MKYRIEITQTALRFLEKIKDKRIKIQIADKIESLANEPEKRGKPLTHQLAGYRSLRTVDGRFRIIYRVEKRKVVVVIAAIGTRKGKSKKDIYQLAKKLFKANLL